MNGLRTRGRAGKHVEMTLDGAESMLVVAFEVDEKCFSDARAGSGQGWLVGDVATNGAMCLVTDHGEVVDPVFNPKVAWLPR